MPNNTDTSSTTRITKLRRIAVEKGPTSAVRPNSGSQALDARLGKAECCVLCNPIVQWATSPVALQETQQGSNWVYSAVYATVTASMPYQPLFGPPPPDATTQVSRNGNVWTVSFVFSSQQQLNFSQNTAFQFECTPSTTISNTITYSYP